MRKSSRIDRPVCLLGWGESRFVLKSCCRGRKVDRGRRRLMRVDINLPFGPLA